MTITSRRRPWRRGVNTQKLEVIPIFIGATGIVDRNIKSYLGEIPGSHNIYNLQRSAILSIAHMLRNVIHDHVSPRCLVNT